MRLKLNEIDNKKFVNREKYDDEIVNEIADSFKADGQWNPIIVIPSDENGYILVSGHYRYLAAKKLKWIEIDVEVKNYDEKTAKVLATKMNLKRKDMADLEIGEQILQLTKPPYNLKHEEIAKEWGKSKEWVQRRYMVAADLIPKIKRMVESDKISISHAILFSRFNSTEQEEILNICLKEDKFPSFHKLEEICSRFKNRIIYTIGYSERGIEDFISVLKSNNIEVVLDVRKSSKSEKKPAFSGDVLARSLKTENIKYVHYPELGAVYDMQNAYKEGYVTYECFSTFYDYKVMDELDKKKMKLNDLAKEINDLGIVILMCMERYPEPKEKRQKYFCHRKILAEMLCETEYYFDVQHVI